jgi:hypothetical protein
MEHDNICSDERGVRAELSRAVALAVGRRALGGVPDLGDFAAALVGHWPNLERFVESLVIQSDMERELDRLPAAVRPFAVIDRSLVAANVRRELVVVNADERVWIFDPRRTGSASVAKTEQAAHSKRHNEELP